MFLGMFREDSRIETIEINMLHSYSGPLLAPIVDEARSDAGFVVSAARTRHNG
jgi:hypothetical protein